MSSSAGSPPPNPPTPPGPPQQPPGPPQVPAPVPQGPGQPPEGFVAKTPWTAYIKPTIWTLVAIYVIAFVFLNRDIVTINFIFFQAQVPLIFVLVGLALIGAGLCAGVMAMTRRRATKEAKLTAAANAKK